MTVGLSIVVPFYNERELLAAMVRAQHCAASSLPGPWEMILVNDGSDDGSGDIADGLARDLDRVTIVSHGVNQRLGAAVRSGIAASTLPLVIAIPVDNPLDARQLEVFLEAAESADVVVGCRPRRAGYSAWMRFASAGLTGVLRVIPLLPPLPDYTWISMFRRSIFASIAFRESGILYQPEIIALAKRQGYRITDVVCPMTARVGGDGTVSKPSTTVRTAFELVKLVFRVWLYPKPVSPPAPK